MIEKTIFELNSIYRDNMRVKGFVFGTGEKSVCIVGATRGNEIQQMYICSQLVKIFTQLEKQGKIKSDKSIMIVPTINNYSMNIGKRFWSTDNTDINRMFPGFNLGETTQRIAAGVFKNISDYKIGIQFASFYVKGSFIPHIRMMKTGFENVELAKDFGLPYVYRRNTRPYDTTTLNYNWQLWETNAFSVYTNATDSLDVKSGRKAINAVMCFLNRNGIIDYKCHEGYMSEVIEGDKMVNVKSNYAGMLIRYAEVNSRVRCNDVLAVILDPYTGQILDTIKSPINGIVFFHADQPLIYSHTPLFRIIPSDDIV